jgi:hypothetical protein
MIHYRNKAVATSSPAHGTSALFFTGTKQLPPIHVHYAHSTLALDDARKRNTKVVTTNSLAHGAPALCGKCERNKAVAISSPANSTKFFHFPSSNSAQFYS